MPFGFVTSKMANEKLNTAGELYQFMMDKFYQGKAFVMGCPYYG